MTELEKLTTLLEHYTHGELRRVAVDAACAWAAAQDIPPYKIRLIIDAVLLQYRVDLTDAASVAALFAQAQTMQFQDIEGLEGLEAELSLTTEQRGAVIGAIMQAIQANINARIAALQGIQMPDIAALLEELAEGSGGGGGE